jgi:hypothetical protein
VRAAKFVEIGKHYRRLVLSRFDGKTDKLTWDVRTARNDVATGILTPLFPGASVVRKRFSTTAIVVILVAISIVVAAVVFAGLTAGGESTTGGSYEQACIELFDAASVPGPAANGDALVRTVAWCDGLEMWQAQAIAHPAAFPPEAVSADGGREVGYACALVPAGDPAPVCYQAVTAGWLGMTADGRFTRVDGTGITA